MFQNLRKKVNSVLPDIENIYISSANGLSNSSSPTRTTTIKSHFGLSLPTLSSSSTSNDASKVQRSHWPNTPMINFNAGCQLLEQNEQLWEDLHVANELNAKKAEECDSTIAKLNNFIGKRCIDLSDINVSLEMIPNILQTLANCSASIIDVNDKCTEVERKLFELEDLMDVLQLQERQLDKKFEMAMYKEHKLGTANVICAKFLIRIQWPLSNFILTGSLERVRQELLSKHAETIRESEKQMRQVQQERQSVFQDAFQSDMNYYKEVGKIPSKNDFRLQHRLK